MFVYKHANDRPTLGDEREERSGWEEEAGQGTRMMRSHLRVPVPKVPQSTEWLKRQRSVFVALSAVAQLPNQPLGLFPMNQHFKQANGGFQDSNAQAIADKGVAATKEFYEKAAVVAKDGARTLTDIVDTAWNTTKMLNDKFAQNVANNVDAAFVAAREIATAKSLPEIGKAQTDFVQKLATQTTEQAKELVDISTSATQQVLVRAQALMTMTLKPPA